MNLDEIIVFARTQLGEMYRFGGELYWLGGEDKRMYEPTNQELTDAAVETFSRYLREPHICERPVPDCWRCEYESCGESLFTGWEDAATTEIRRKARHARHDR